MNSRDIMALNSALSDCSPQTTAGCTPGAGLAAGKTLRILFVEDNPTDVRLATGLLENDGLDCETVTVETKAELMAALERGGFDLIFSDNSLPSFDGLSALAIAQNICPSVPFIFVSGTLGEEVAIESLKQGATDYVLKQRIHRLVPATRRALHQAREKTERQRVQKHVQLHLVELEQAKLELYKSEARFRAFMNNSPTIAFIEDAEGRFVFVNELFERSFNLQPLDWYGRTPFELWPTETAKRLKAYHARVLGADTVVEFSETLPQADGNHEWLIFEFPIEDTSGRRLVAGIGLDITERKKAQQELLNAEEQLRQAQKMEAVGRLAGAIAHDFNNVLTVIMGYCELILGRGLRDEIVWKDVNEIRTAGERAASLTRQLLAFSRRQFLQPQVLNVNEQVASAEALLCRLIGEDIELVTVKDPNLNGVMADAGQIQQVIMNLAVNARDAMLRGGRLTIQTANVELDSAVCPTRDQIKPGRWVMLAVTDTGIGMDADTQARLFEPFFTTKEPGKGTGIGLSTVYNIVKQSEGIITVESQLEHGTTFRIFLPAVQAQAEQTAVAPPQVEDLHGKETILVAEDEESVRELTKRILEHYGYTVLVAKDGTEALQISRFHPGKIHLLLSDAVLPGMDGRELAERISDMIPEVKIIYTSGYADQVIIDPKGPFLQKPFTPEALAHTVRQMIDR